MSKLPPPWGGDEQRSFASFHIHGEGAEEHLFASFHLHGDRGEDEPSSAQVLRWVLVERKDGDDEQASEALASLATTEYFELRLPHKARVATLANLALSPLSNDPASSTTTPSASHPYISTLALLAQVALLSRLCDEVASSELFRKRLAAHMEKKAELLAQEAKEDAERKAAALAEKRARSEEASRKEVAEEVEAPASEEPSEKKKPIKKKVSRV